MSPQTQPLSSQPSGQPISQHPDAGKPRPDKAKAILWGALEIFIADGYAAASMDRIARAAKVSKPTLYKYFEDKECLFMSLMQQLLQGKREMLVQALVSPNESISPEAVLRHVAMSVIDSFSADQALLRLMRLMIGESERFPEVAKSFVREIEKPVLETLADYLASQPQLQLPDPMVAARIFAGSLVHYLIIQNVLYGSEILPMERDRMVDGLVDVLTARIKC